MDTGAVKAHPTGVTWELFRVAETPAEYVLHRPRLYLETTIPSYLTARPCRDLHKTRLRLITARWWDSWHTQFEIFSSELVREEAESGNREAALRRLRILERLPELSRCSKSEALANELLQRSGLPRTAENDAEHIAIACVHNIEYLLSWNCAHLANPQTAPRIDVICRQEGYLPPVLCTPEQLLMRYEHGHMY